jgi:hypothetical protein
LLQFSMNVFCRGSYHSMLQISYVCFLVLRLCQRIHQGLRLYWTFCNRLIFYGGWLLTHHQTPEQPLVSCPKLLI